MRIIKSILPILVLTMALTSLPQSLRADEYGLVFSSYEVGIHDRTSLQIAFPPSRTLEIKGSEVRICFDIKIDNTKEAFGYICRIPVAEGTSLDIILSNSRIVRNSVDILAVLGDEVVSVLPEGKRLTEWNNVEIGFHEIDDTLAVDINGSRMTSVNLNSEPKISAILFGRHNFGDLRSDDVAPMILRNLVIDSHGRRTSHYEYPLKDASGLAGSVSNPIWLSEYNTKWHLILDLPVEGKVFHVLDRKNHYLYKITENCVDRYSLVTHVLESRPFPQQITLGPLTNDFGVLPDGTLYYFDAETYTTATFDWDSSSWSKDIIKDTFSPYLGHSTFYNPKDSSVVQLFGYGYHKYSNEAHTWNVSTGKFRRFNLDGIPPRYFSCLYQTDSSVFVIGGLGNNLGLQELGIEVLSDVYEINLSDYSVSKVALPKQAYPEAMVSYGSAIQHKGNYNFLAFPFSSSTSELSLVSYNPVSAKIESRSGMIGFSMSQWSEFYLDYVEELDTWYAIVSEIGPKGIYHTFLYSSVNPLGYIETAPVTKAPWPVWRTVVLAVLLAAILSFVVIVCRRKLRRKKVHIRGVHPERPGIYLIGIFRVVDKNGKEIGSQFSPLMKELLSCIILNYKKGISAPELNMALWPDMEETNFRNNFRVNLKKVRDVLKNVVPIEIYKDGGLWKVTMNEDDCDYFVAMSTAEELSNGYIPEAAVDRLARRFKTGNLLEDISAEWLDSYKADYSSTIISMCYRLADDFRSPETRLKIAEIILSLDSLEEDAAAIKCKSLVQMKRLNYAQDYYRSFSQEYQRVMGEPFEKSYKDFVK